MAIYELNEGQLLRVARSVDGKLRQVYFSVGGLNKTQQRSMRRAAKAKDQAWKGLQEKAKAKRMRKALTDEQHTTGVRGINLVRRPGPAFRVQIQTNGKSFVREFSVNRLGVAKAWARAIKYLSECRGYKSTPKAWSTRMPTVG